ncbi:MAG: hypothetical protein ACI4JF_08735 [Oscillospiraceae bacterium]
MSDISKTLDECTRMLHQMIEIEKENIERLSSIEKHLDHIIMARKIKRAYLLYSIMEEYQLDEQSFYDTEQ